MKKQLLVLAILFMTVGLSAQTQPNTSRWSIGLLAGPAIPVGAFAGIHNSWSGGKTVSAGGIAEVSGTYRIWRFFSAAVAVNGQFNHGNGINSNLVTIYAYDRPGDLPTSLFGKDWQITRYLAGGLFTLHLSKKTGTILLLRALAGIQKTRTPDFSYPDPNFVPVYSGSYYVPGQTLPSAFSYQLDAGIKWHLQGRWALLAYAGYDGCRPSIRPELVSIPPAERVPGPNGPGPLMTPGKTTLPTGTVAIRFGAEMSL